MPRTTINGGSIHYEVIGNAGPWVSVSPGGRRGFDELGGYARRFAEAGFRVLVHDRRNCGASDLVLEGDQQEHEIWADDLHALLASLGVDTAFIGGSSSGARMALSYGLRYPGVTKGLLLWRTSGSARSTRHLANQYYGSYAEIARKGGMQAVADSDHFKAVIARNPAAREQLMRYTPERFIRSMTAWSEGFMKGAEQPIIGASEAELRAMHVPVCLIPGNDFVHARSSAYAMAKLVPHCEMHDIMPAGPDLEEIPFASWEQKEADIAALFIAFMRKRGAA